VCLLLLLAVWAVFGQTAGFRFVNYDDQIYVYENPVVQQGLTLKGALWALTYGEIGHWHPLTWLTHMADCQVYGLWAGGHHLTNVALHAAASALLFLALRSMTGALWRSAFVAAVFAVHPLRAESVAWISERKDVLGGVFFMLTLWAYIGYTRRPSRGRGAAVALLYGLGLLSKNMLVTLPFLLLLLDWWPLRRMKGAAEATAGLQSPGIAFWGLVREKVPLFALSFGSCLATDLAPEKIGSMGRVPLAVRAGNAAVSCVTYLRQLFYPSNLAIPYLYPPGGIPAWKTGLTLVLLAGLTALVLACRRKCPYLLVGWFWYLGMLVPVSGIVQISYYARADRYTYLPGIGLALAATWAVADWSTGWKYRRAVLGGLMAAVAGALIMLGHRQTSYWRDNESLWTRVLACTSGNCVAYNCLGTALAAKGQNDQAIDQYRKALEIKPDYAEPRSNLGLALFNKGEKQEAIAQYREALDISPDFADARNNLGVALFDKGDKAEAIAQYRHALQIKPDYAEARSNLGVALLDKGETEQAIAQFRAALEINPQLGKTRRCLGLALLRKGDFDEAMACFQKAATASLAPFQKWLNLGDDLSQEGNVDDAIICYQKALKTNPASADACVSLGLAFFHQGQIKEAMGAWQQALEIKPDQAVVQNNLAWLLATTPEASLRDGAKAVRLARQANHLNGGANPIVLQTLAAAYAETGRYGDALATARRALKMAAAQKSGDLANALQQQIKLYEAGQPMRSGLDRPGETDSRQR